MYKGKMKDVNESFVKRVITQGAGKACWSQNHTCLIMYLFKTKTKMTPKK